LFQLKYLLSKIWDIVVLKIYFLFILKFRCNRHLIFCLEKLWPLLPAPRFHTGLRSLWPLYEFLALLTDPLPGARWERWCWELGRCPWLLACRYPGVGMAIYMGQKPVSWEGDELSLFITGEQFKWSVSKWLVSLEHQDWGKSWRLCSWTRSRASSPAGFQGTQSLGPRSTWQQHLPGLECWPHVAPGLWACPRDQC
jgi:hypothetical protein